MPPPLKALYIFLDEGGDLNFSATGSKYFTLSSVTVTRPFPVEQELHDLRFNLIESGLDIHYFHASEDRQPVRDQVYALIRAAIDAFQVDSILVEKRKAEPPMREDHRFYPEMLGHLLKHVVSQTDPSRWSEIIVITDRIPVNSKRQAVEKAVKTTLAHMLPKDMMYRVLHHDSRSSCGLQVADYFNWAVFRAWERGDPRSLDLVRKALRSQLDIFGKDLKAWY